MHEIFCPWGAVSLRDALSLLLRPQMTLSAFLFCLWSCCHNQREQKQSPWDACGLMYVTWTGQWVLDWVSENWICSSIDPTAVFISVITGWQSNSSSTAFIPRCPVQITPCSTQLQLLILPVLITTNHQCGDTNLKPRPLFFWVWITMRFPLPQLVETFSDCKPRGFTTWLLLTCHQDPLRCWNLWLVICTNHWIERVPHAEAATTAGNAFCCRYRDHERVAFRFHINLRKNYHQHDNTQTERQ